MKNRKFEVGDEVEIQYNQDNELQSRTMRLHPAEKRRYFTRSEAKKRLEMHAVLDENTGKMLEYRHMMTKPAQLGKVFL